MKGVIKLYIDGQFFLKKEYHHKSVRKKYMAVIHKIYHLENKHHYWQIIPPESPDIQKYSETIKLNGVIHELI